MLHPKELVHKKIKGSFRLSQVVYILQNGGCINMTEKSSVVSLGKNNIWLRGDITNKLVGYEIIEQDLGYPFSYELTKPFTDFKIKYNPKYIDFT